MSGSANERANPIKRGVVGSYAGITLCCIQCHPRGIADVHRAFSFLSEQDRSFFALWTGATMCICLTM